MVGVAAVGEFYNVIMAGPERAVKGILVGYVELDCRNARRFEAGALYCR